MSHITCLLHKRRVHLIDVPVNQGGRTGQSNVVHRSDSTPCETAVVVIRGTARTATEVIRQDRKPVERVPTGAQREDKPRLALPAGSVPTGAQKEGKPHKSLRTRVRTARIEEVRTRPGKL